MKRRASVAPIFTQEKRETEESAPASQSAAERIMWTQQTFGNRFVQQRATSCPDLSACPTGGACEKCQQQQAQTKLGADRTKDPEEEKDPKEAEAEEIERRAEELPEDKTAGKLSVAGRTEAPRVQRACDECEKDEEKLLTDADETFSSAGTHGHVIVSAPMSHANAPSVGTPRASSHPEQHHAGNTESQRAVGESSRGAVGANAVSSGATPSSNAVTTGANISTPAPIKATRPNTTPPSASTQTTSTPPISTPPTSTLPSSSESPTSTTPSAEKPQSRIEKAESPNEPARQTSPAAGPQATTDEPNRVTSGANKVSAPSGVKTNAESNQRSVKANEGARAREEADGEVSQATSPAVVVEDSVEVAPGQMRRSEFITEVQAAVRETTEEVLEGTCWSADDSPYVDHWVNRYRTKDSRQIRRALRRDVPATEFANTAEEAIGYIREHVRRAVEIWVNTGKITGVPEGVAIKAPSAPPDEKSKAGKFRRELFFKGRDGGAKEADDPRVIQSRLGSGRPLEGGVKSRMESAFGQDFSAVRVHTDSAASDLSAKQNARAFTVGEDVAFGAGEYKPGTPVGDALLAHELAHVVQQGGAVESEAPLKKDVTEHGAMEDDADTAAVGAVVSLWSGMKGGLADVGRSAMPRLKSGLSLQRCGKCKLKSGPTYDPGGTLTPTKPRGQARGVRFLMGADFDTSEKPSCCEARQYIQWTSEADRPRNGGFEPAKDFPPNNWVEDRGPNNERFGHRSAPNCYPDGQYKNEDNVIDCESGSKFRSSDDPEDSSGAKTGEWKFMLKVIDTCNGDADVGSPAFTTIDW